MPRNQFFLLGTRRFLPLFVTQSFGAFNDNLFKNALVILITFELAEQSGLDAGVMVTAAAGIFILPFLLFSATAGQLADKYDKAGMIRRVKQVEILLMCGAAAGFYLQSIPVLMGVLFLMGTQSAFFGPLKYGILPDHLREHELISGNGLIQAATFLAILLGTVVGGIFILAWKGTLVISVLVIGVAISGWFFSRFIPNTAPAAPQLKININFLTETWKIIRYTAERPSLFYPVVAVSWFWLVGATFLAQVPTLGKVSLNGDESLVTLLLLIFSVGIGIGSLLCNRLLKGQVHGAYVPYGALGLSLFAVDLYFATRGGLVQQETALMGALQFMGSLSNWRILVDFLLIAVFGGIYVVPLNTMIQARSEPSHRARNISALNILNSLFMVISALASAVLLGLGFTVPQIFLYLAILNLGVVFLTIRLK
ncbi:MAG: MFS transporter [Gammaproteobacteria bacterium]|nr:MFS transporter [Gammaproteobacteria bacterium]